MQTNKLFFFIVLLLALAGCRTLLLSRVRITENAGIKTQDSSWTDFKLLVAQHYDSTGKIKQKVRDALGDNFVERNISLFPSGVDTLSGRVIAIGDVSGISDAEDYEWLVYKMKKHALMKGANLIASFNASYYEEYTFWYYTHLLSHAAHPEDVLKKVKCTGKAVYLIPAKTN